MFYFILFYIFLFGLAIGSFLNCLIWRLRGWEKGETPFVRGVLSGRSYCPKCRKQIKWYDNIPVLSFIILRGKCRNCGKPISWQYPLVELITAVLFVVSWQIESGIRNQESGFVLSSIIYNSKFIIQVLRDWFLIAAMIVVFIYDLRWYVILDIITLPSAAILLFFNLIIGLLNGSGFSILRNFLISGIIGGSFFLLQFIISRARWIGGGDIRLGFLMGLALGWPGVIIALLLAYFSGSIIGLGLIAAKKKQWGSQVPFGTFLAAATIVTLFWGQEIIGWYWGLIQ